MGRSDGIVKVGGLDDAYVFDLPVQSGRENDIVVLVECRVYAERIGRAANRHLPAYARPRNIKITGQITLLPTGK